MEYKCCSSCIPGLGALTGYYKLGQLSPEYETGRAIGLKEAGWSNRLIARHLCRSDAAIRRCWKKWVNNGRMQRQDGSG
ncbi:hypothetical protein LAZ67_1005602 [Cordylochernes scorpioides]|uniref:Helix-turn-helix domain-containing protein n=1 Tax=Cordylochernes scorpioides TaxID=51811 RepID=A0ABY6JYH4_9ARAC|nr:hypothetical protein LAZ67_1005602 [Cordylochernes scorpioides]